MTYAYYNNRCPGDAKVKNLDHDQETGEKVSGSVLIYTIIAAMQS